MSLGYSFAVFTAGLFSFFSPCILPVLPIYIGYFSMGESGQKTSTIMRLIKTLAFVLGVSTVFFILGLGASFVGSFFKSSLFSLLCGILIVFMGMYQAGIIVIPQLSSEKSLKDKAKPKNTIFGAFLLGLLFSFGWTPCIGPILSSVLGLSLESGDMVAGFIMLTIYSLGFSIPFIIMSLASQFLMIKVKKLMPHMKKIQIAGGILIIIMGVYMIAGQIPSLLNNNSEDNFIVINEESDVKSWEGKKVYMKFWATWCPMCLSGMEEFSQLAEDLKDEEDIVICSVVAPGQKNEMEEEEFIEWAKGQKLDFPIILDSSGSLNKRYGVKGYPTSVFLDKNGELMLMQSGHMSNELIAKKLGIEGYISGEKESGFLSRNSKQTKLKEIYFAGGCFWGVESYFSQIIGVVDVSCGYANGNKENPTYSQVCSGGTGHAETVHVLYDPQIVSLQTLTEHFFKIINPLTKDRQGFDIGNQYRTGVYYTDNEDAKIIRSVFDKEQKKYDKKIVTELLPLSCYYLAEEEHQDYLVKNPNGYCHIDFSSLEELEQLVDPTKYTKPSEKEMKKYLSEEEYNITQNGQTEYAHNGKYNDFFEPGIYVDVVTGEPLFLSSDKFESGCGWPSFSKPIAPEVIVEYADNSYGMTRREVRSRVGNSHLGHVFEDGPKELGGLRYCINSGALRFVRYDSMEESGYGWLMNLVSDAPKDKFRLNEEGSEAVISIGNNKLTYGVIYTVVYQRKKEFENEAKASYDFTLTPEDWKTKMPDTDKTIADDYMGKALDELKSQIGSMTKLKKYDIKLTEAEINKINEKAKREYAGFETALLEKSGLRLEDWTEYLIYCASYQKVCEKINDSYEPNKDLTKEELELHPNRIKRLKDELYEENLKKELSKWKFNFNIREEKIRQIKKDVFYS